MIMFMLGVVVLLLLVWVFIAWPLFRSSSTEANAADANVTNMRWVFSGLVITVIVVAGALYGYLGSYPAWQVKQALAKRTELQRQYLLSGDEALISQVQAANEHLLVVLASALTNEPRHTDLQLRALYARTLMGITDYDKAIEQFQKILLVEPESPQIIAELAQAVFVQAGNRINPMVESLVTEVLKRDADNLIALGLAGVAAFQAKDYQEAIEYWERAIQQQEANTPNVQALRSGIQRAREYLEQPPSAPSQQSQSAEQALQQPSQQSSQQNESIAEAVTVKVAIASLDDVQPQDTVFVYARAWQGARMPLAIQRLKVEDLPTTVTLTEAMAMAPGMSLTSAEQLELVARVSKSGSPMPQVGDWQASYGPLTLEKSSTDEKTIYELLIKEPIL